MSKDHPDFVTVTHGMRGYFAVHLTWNSDHGGFYEPWNSGIGSFATPSEAYPEGRSWAEAEEIEFREVDEPAMIASVERSNARSRRIAELRAEGMDAREAWNKAREEFAI